MARKPYPSDISDDEWALVAPYLTLMSEDAPQRDYPLREVFNGLRWIVRAGAPWRMLQSGLPPWEAVYQQTQRWLTTGVFEQMINDWRELLRVAAGARHSPREPYLIAARSSPALQAAYEQAISNQPGVWQETSCRLWSASGCPEGDARPRDESSANGTMITA